MSTTTRRDPSDAAAPVHEAVSRSSAGPEREVGSMLERTFPDVIFETPEEYVIRGPLFRTRPEHVRITTDGNTLTIRDGQKAARPSVDGITWRRERFETFLPDGSRTITLPGHIDPKKVNAEYEDGVLTIYVGKEDQNREYAIPLHVKE
jgi:HSP20 family molecular chaperone IbpA